MLHCSALAEREPASVFSALPWTRPSLGYSFSSHVDSVFLVVHVAVVLFSFTHTQTTSFDAMNTEALLTIPSSFPPHCHTTLCFASSAVFLVALTLHAVDAPKCDVEGNDAPQFTPEGSTGALKFTVEGKVLRPLSLSLHHTLFFDGFRGTLQQREDGSVTCSFRTRSDSCSSAFEMRGCRVQEEFTARVRSNNEDYPFVIANEEAKCVDLSVLPRLGCFAFDVSCLTVNLSPFTFHLQSTEHSCAYDSIKGVKVDDHPSVLYGDACTENDTLSFFLDAPRDSFHAFLEGTRIGYTYLEDFGTPAWKEQRMPLHNTLTHVDLQINPYNRIAFDPNVLLVPEMSHEEWMLRAGALLTASVSLQASYEYYCTWMRSCFVLCLSRATNHFVFIDTDPVRLRARFPGLSVGQTVHHPSTNAACTIVGQSGGYLWYSECADNPFESGREEYSMVWRMSEYWVRKEQKRAAEKEETSVEAPSPLSFEAFCEVMEKARALAAVASCIDSKCRELGLWAWNLSPSVLSRVCPAQCAESEWLVQCAAVLFQNLLCLQILPYLLHSSVAAPLLSSTVQLLSRDLVLRTQRAVEPSVDLQHLPRAIKSHTFNRLAARRERLLSLPLQERFAASVTHHLIAVLMSMNEEELRTAFIQHSHGGQKRVFHVVFAGEGGVDNGGLYREVFRTCMQELHDVEMLNVLRATPNHEIVGDVGGKEDFVFDEGCTFDAKVYEGIGRIIGIAIVSGFQLDLFLSPVLWKLIVGERVGWKDLEMVNKGLYDQCCTLLSTTVILRCAFHV